MDELDRWRSAVSLPLASFRNLLAGVGAELARCKAHSLHTGQSTCELERAEMDSRRAAEFAAIKIIEEAADKSIKLALATLARGPVSRTNQSDEIEIESGLCVPWLQQHGGRRYNVCLFLLSAITDAQGKEALSGAAMAGLIRRESAGVFTIDVLSSPWMSDLIAVRP
jgi:hypothetical protein